LKLLYGKFRLRAKMTPFVWCCGLLSAENGRYLADFFYCTTLYPDDGSSKYDF